MSNRQQQHRLGQIILVVIAFLLVLPMGSRRIAEARPVPLKQADDRSSATETNYSEHQENWTRHDVIDEDVKTAYAESKENLLDDECFDEEVCDRKRLLTAHTDYQTDGPNDPITDPSH